MSLRTVGLERVVLPGGAATNVLARRYRIEMRWVAAQSIAASVIQLDALRDRAVLRFKHHAMDAPRFSVDANVPVPIRAPPLPCPAAMIECHAREHSVDIVGCDLHCF